MDLKPDAAGARVLVCACTPLPGDEHAENEPTAQGGYVIVFDDISALAAGAARRGLGRSGAPPGARDQESAHADPALRRAHAPPLPRPDDGRGRADPRSRDVHDRAAGRGDEGDGERVQRIRARAGHEGHEIPAQCAGHRGRGPASRAGIRREDRRRSRSAHREGRSRPRPRAPDPQQSHRQRRRGRGKHARRAT